MSLSPFDKLRVSGRERELTQVLPLMLSPSKYEPFERWPPKAWTLFGGR